MLEQSIYTYLFQKGERNFLYNSKTSFFAEISKDLFEGLYNRDYADMPSDTIDELTRKGILCDNAERYSYYYGEKLRFLSSCFDKKGMSLVVVPTTSCNFACPYCFEGEKINAVMPEEIQDKLVKQLDDDKELENISITWYGGEPLMAFSVIKSLYSKLKDLKDKTISGHTIVTNGYLIKDEVIDFINEASVSDMQITLDGVKERHDRLRCLKDCKSGTFDRIMDNIRRVISECPDVRLNIRVNIDLESRHDFTRLYKNIHGEFDTDRIYVYPGFIREDTDDGCSLCYNSFSPWKRLEFYRELHEEGIPLGIIQRATTSRGCMLHSLNAMIVGPSGEIYKCWNDVNHKDKTVASVGNPEITNQHLYMHQMNETHCFSDPKCKDCLAFPVCSGGCGWYRSRNILENGQFNICDITSDRRILEELLLMTLDTDKTKYKHYITVS